MLVHTETKWIHNYKCMDFVMFVFEQVFYPPHLSTIGMYVRMLSCT